MMTTVKQFLSSNISDSDAPPLTTGSQEMKNVSLNGLAFHGIGLDKMEKSSISEEMRRNFLEHMILRLLRREWGVVHRGSFRNICR